MRDRFPTPKFQTKAALRAHVTGCLADGLITEQEAIDLWSCYVLYFDENMQHRSATRDEFYAAVGLPQQPPD